MIIAGLLYSAGYFFVGHATGILTIIVGVLIVTFGELIESPTSSTYVSSLAPPGKSGAYMGANGMALMLGWSVGPFVGGMLLDYTKTPIHAWTGISILALVASLGFAVLKSFEKKNLSSRSNNSTY